MPSRSLILILTAGVLAALPAALLTAGEPVHAICDAPALTPSDMKQCHWEMKNAPGEPDRQRIRAMFEAKVATRQAAGLPATRTRSGAPANGNSARGLGITGGQPLNILRPY